MSGPFVLRCHPHTPVPWVDSVAVALRFGRDGGLALSYRLEGDAGRLRLPPQGESKATDGLWRHTCFEAFLAGDRGPAYREFNFSPSGAWAGYAFGRYRRGGTALDMSDPGIVCQRDGDGFGLEAVIDAASLPSGRRLRIGLSAVLEDVEGALSYWALYHPPGQPDFHAVDSFILELDRP